jgi:hypothetical protein
MAPALPAPAPVVDEPQVRNGRSLSELVADYGSTETPDAETECLARAVYYESKGEPLTGQLTVAEVVLNRAHSGRFPSTICGVVRQPGQFSFVHRGYIPTPPVGSRDWRIAVAHFPHRHGRILPTAPLRGRLFFPRPPCPPGLAAHLLSRRSGTTSSTAKP